MFEWYKKEKPVFTGIARGVGGFGFGKSAGIRASSGGGATGGTIIPSATSGNGYTYHVFLYPNVDNFIVNSSLTADVLIVAGGGAGGANFYAGAGGAGGVIYGSNVSFPVQTYMVQVGRGGLAEGAQGGSGENSIFGSVTAIGGGGGGSSPLLGLTGGSSGGNGSSVNTPVAKTPQPVPVSYTAYGNDSSGGPSTPGTYLGGQGGAGAQTQNYAPSPENRGGFGGDGIAMPAFPATIIAPVIPAPVRPRWNSPDGNGAVSSPPGVTYYGGGGGGANYYTTTGVPVGGLGGGGNGGGPSTNPNPQGQFCNGYPGVDFTGGGGGGTNYNSGNRNPYNPSTNGGNGGHGIVIIRYQ